MDSSVVAAVIEDAEAPNTEAPIVVTPTHVYMILPVDQWPAAYRFVADHVGPDTLVEDDHESTSILAAVNRETYAIEGVLFVNRVVIAQHFACVPAIGVSYSRFHELVRASLPEGTMYYSDGADGAGTERAVDAARRAGLAEVGKLWYGVAVSSNGREGDDAVGSDHSGSHRGSGSVPLVEEREEGRSAV